MVEQRSLRSFVSVNRCLLCDEMRCTQHPAPCYPRTELAGHSALGWPIEKFSNVSAIFSSSRSAVPSRDLQSAPAASLTRKSRFRTRILILDANPTSTRRQNTQRIGEEELSVPGTELVL